MFIGGIILGLAIRPIIFRRDTAHDLAGQLAAESTVRHDSSAISIFEHDHRADEAIIIAMMQKSSMR